MYQVSITLATAVHCHDNLYSGDLDAASLGQNTYVCVVFHDLELINFIIFCSLKAVIDRPPIEDREFAPLSELQGFKLQPGAVSYCDAFLYSKFYLTCVNNFNLTFTGYHKVPTVRIISSKGAN